MWQYVYIKLYTSLLKQKSWPDLPCGDKAISLTRNQICVVTSVRCSFLNLFLNSVCNLGGSITTLFSLRIMRPLEKRPQNFTLQLQTSHVCSHTLNESPPHTAPICSKKKKKGNPKMTHLK